MNAKEQFSRIFFSTTLAVAVGSVALDREGSVPEAYEFNGPEQTAVMPEPVVTQRRIFYI